MTLVRICGQHRHAVERDLISLGFRWDDVGTRLSLWELLSIVIASPPGTAVYHAETRVGTMTPDQRMLASMTGFSTTQANTPDVPVAEPAPEMQPFSIGGTPVQLDAMTPEELVRKRAEIAARIEASHKADKVEKEKYDPFAASKAARAERLAQIAKSERPSGPALPQHISGM